LDCLDVLDDKTSSLHGFFTERASLRRLVEAIKETVENFCSLNAKVLGDFIKLFLPLSHLFVSLYIGGVLSLFLFFSC